MTKFTVKYNKIYLVAIGQSIHTELRVTNRDGVGSPPATCMFSGARADAGGNPMGTLVIDDPLWQSWYSKYNNYIPGMETAKSAAEKMVRENSNIHYGCPLCPSIFPSLAEAQAHTESEVLRLIEQFDVKVLGGN